MSRMSIKNAFFATWIGCCRALRKKKVAEPILPRRFLIASTTGLGDTLWATPAIKALRQTYPDAYIALLTTNLGKQVLETNRHLDDLFIWKWSSALSLFFALRKKKFQTVLVFHTSQRAILPLCFFTKAREIIGTAGINKGLDFILTTACEKKAMHEIERRLEIAACAGARTQDSTLELFLTSEDEKKADLFLHRQNVPAYLPLVGIHPGAKDKFKQWDPACFVEVGNRLSQDMGCLVIVTGNSGEKELVEQIAGQIRGAVPLAGELSVRGLAALMKRMTLVVANDTGPMHLAFAVNTPTVALFGPTDPKSCGPYFAPRATVIQKPATCSPCLRKRCNEPFCMLQISPGEVLEACMPYLYHKQPL
jgi:lipopolysaccharide heptosyltransferase II